jgi:hypothetical protein
MRRFIRHCERSEAIHGAARKKVKVRVDCFVASLLAMTDKHTSDFPRRDAPELLRKNP